MFHHKKLVWGIPETRTMSPKTVVSVMTGVSLKMQFSQTILDLTLSFQRVNQILGETQFPDNLANQPNPQEDNTQKQKRACIKRSPGGKKDGVELRDCATVGSQRNHLLTQSWVIPRLNYFFEWNPLERIQELAFATQQLKKNLLV